MLTLKDYQRNALDALKMFFDNCDQFKKADIAFYKTTSDLYGTGIAYFPVEGLEELPYVCIRIPTGGGKTLVGCHSIGVAAKNFLFSDRPVTLWLVPSNAIKEQTLKSLKDSNHPYYEAIRSSLGSFTVLDVVDALYTRRSSYEMEPIIIVSTMQAFRVEDTDGRKVYESSGELKDHFDNLPSHMLDQLEKNEEGELIYSLANVLRLRRPLVIVDEAHNARTDLSFETLARFNPSGILEFTATPDIEQKPSNVLYSVSAAELKSEEMIKIPIRVENKNDWKTVLADAVSMRNYLEKVANQEYQITGEYIRPVLLIQAQPNRKDRESITWEIVEKHLIEDHRIPKDQIAVETGQRRDLEDVNILANNCEYRFVITIQALREGWDCPFAYVLCSVAEIGSNTAVEQMVGRIMRLPRAKRKVHEELNEAYAFVSSEAFGSALDALEYALIQNGFKRKEAREFLAPIKKGVQQETLDFFGAVTVDVPEKPNLTTLPSETAEKVEISDGKMTFKGVMSDQDRTALKNCFATEEGKVAVEKIYQESKGYGLFAPQEQKKSPSEQGKIFSIPFLGVKQGSLFEPFDETHSLEISWSLAERDAMLSEEEFILDTTTGKFGAIDVTDKGQLLKKQDVNFLDVLHRQMTFFEDDENWTQPLLVWWLDRQIPHQDIIPAEAGVFINNTITNLIEKRRLTLGQLVRNKYKLKKAMTDKIEKYRKHARKENYQAFLFDDSKFEVRINDQESCFSLDPFDYAYNQRYSGSHEFQKHYYRAVGDLGSQGEEFDCARYIDLMDCVEYWVRNIPKKRRSFWLQTSIDRFYPDFICKLKDGRYLVVEYKGAHLWKDAEEERNIGALWELKSNGKCLFIMIKNRNFHDIDSKVAK